MGGTVRDPETLEVAGMLRRARVDAGLSQREVADRMGARQSGLSRIESALVSPTIHTLARLADALGCELRVRLVPRGRAGERDGAERTA